MKTIAKVALFVAATLSFAACVKEIEPASISKNEEVQLIFSSVKPALTDVETRTAWNGTTINWSKGDNVRIAYTVNGDWQGEVGAATPAKLYASTALTEDAAIADFTVSANFKDTENQGLENPEYKFYGVYPSSIVSGTDFTPTTISFTLPNEQTPAEASFANGVDIMYATSDAYQGIPSNRKVDLYWHRVVSHADISMRNVMVEEGETLESITVTAQDGADLTGQHTLDITDGTIALPSGKTGLNSVIIKPTNLTFRDGAVEFWFTTLPFTATELTFTVKTNKYLYVRTFTGLNLEFKGNARNTLSVNMKKANKLQDYTESFSAGQGEFSISGDAGIWTASSYQNDHFMKATSRINNVNTDGTAWLISPFLKINSSDSELSFEHAINNYFGTVSDEATVWAREKDGNWTKLTITYPDTPSSGFTNFETTSASLSAYNGKTIQIGFKYIGAAATGVGTWEIKDFKVTNSEVVYYPTLTFTGETTRQVASTGATVEFTYEAAHLTSDPTVSIKAGSDEIIDGTPSIANGKVTVIVKTNNDEEDKTATLVVSCEGVDNIPELVINQAAKTNLVETEATIDFTAQGYTDGQVISTLSQEPFLVTFTKGTNDTKYFTSDNTVRFYKSGGSMTIKSEDYDITEISFSGTYSFTGTVNVGTYTSGKWTGMAKEVSFSATNTCKVSKLTIKYLAPASTDPVITLSNLPTANIDADGDVVTVNYEITNPVDGVSVSASAGSNTWVNSFDYSTPGEISFVVDPNSASSTRTATITVSYTGATPQSFEITQNGTGGGSNTPVTVTKTINEIVDANGYIVSSGSTINDIIKSIALDDVLTMSTSGDDNCGSFWGTTTYDWRLYQAQKGDLTIAVSGNHSLVSVKFTYTNSNGGSLYDGGSAVATNNVKTLSGTSKTFTVGSTTGKTNGQVRLTAIEVVYK